MIVSPLSSWGGTWHSNTQVVRHTVGFCFAVECIWQIKQNALRTCRVGGGGVYSVMRNRLWSVRWKVRRMSDMRLIRLSKVARHFVVGIGIGACAQVFDSQPIGCSQIARLIKFQWGQSWAGVAVWILGRSIVLCISSWRLANGNANLSYRCILAGVDSHCLLSAFRQHHQCSNHPPPPFPAPSELVTTFWMPFR